MVKQKKILVVFYSRTGNTKKVARIISKQLGAELSEITPLTNYHGGVGFLKAFLSGMFHRSPKIKHYKMPTNYDLVIIGTPKWPGGVSSPIRTFLKNEKFRRVAFFCTKGGLGSPFKPMEKLSNKPLATLDIDAKETSDNSYKQKIVDFLNKIK
ncbi:hypothetical protein GOV14_00275 [Candidatus Pacearchaeota archaeon]|nr:hypothetical protein [Candidatus Pacearchaeota archaeon]